MNYWPYVAYLCHPNPKATAEVWWRQAARFPCECVNTVKCHAHSSNRCIGDSTHARLCAAYSEWALRRIGTGTVTIADGVASRAYDSPRKSNRVDGANSLCPSVANNAKRVVRPPPICVCVCVCGSHRKRKWVVCLVGIQNRVQQERIYENLKANAQFDRPHRKWIPNKVKQKKRWNDLSPRQHYFYQHMVATCNVS